MVLNSNVTTSFNIIPVENLFFSKNLVFKFFSYIYEMFKCDLSFLNHNLYCNYKFETKNKNKITRNITDKWVCNFLYFEIVRNARHYAGIGEQSVILILFYFNALMDLADGVYFLPARLSLAKKIRKVSFPRMLTISAARQLWTEHLNVNHMNTTKHLWFYCMK